MNPFIRMAAVVIWVTTLMGASLSTGEVRSQKQAGTSDADMEWRALEELRIPAGPPSQDPTTYRLVNELSSRKYRELGLQFFRKYPTDERRWEWLMAAVSRKVPSYYRNAEAGAADPAHAEIDVEAMERWQRIYVHELRPVFLAEPRTTAYGGKRELQLAEWDWEKRMAREDLKVGRKQGTWRLIERLIWLADEYPEDNFLSALDDFLHWPETWGIDGDLEGKMVDALLASKNRDFRELAVGRARIHAFRNRPVAFTAKAMDGAKIDLSALRGKVVLLDFWGVYCSVCFEEMKKFKRLYDKYHPAGFEVVSIGVDYKGQTVLSQWEKALPSKLKWMNREGITWPVVLGGLMEDGTSYRSYFGITTIPVVLLFDKSGLLVTTEVIGRDIEPLLRELLNLSPLPSGSGGVSLSGTGAK